MAITEKTHYETQKKQLVRMCEMMLQISENAGVVQKIVAKIVECWWCGGHSQECVLRSRPGKAQSTKVKTCLT